MYKLTKDEIEMYVTTIHNAYPHAPEAAMKDMRERFGQVVLADNFLPKANAAMDTLNTAMLINNLSRKHLTGDMALVVIEHFNDAEVVSQVHSEWPDEQMEEKIQLIVNGTFVYPAVTIAKKKQLKRVSAPKKYVVEADIRFVRHSPAV